MAAKKRKRVISHYDFVRDLARGAVGEDVVVDFFKAEFGLCAENVSTRNPDFDLMVEKLDPRLSKSRNVVADALLKKILREELDCARRDFVTIEVKLDAAAAKYKNFFVEVFFDISTGSPGSIFKCKADIIAWVVPGKRKKYKIYLLKRPEFLAWFFDYVFSRKIKLKTPSISPQARGVAVPIADIEESFACIGVWDFQFKG